MSRVEGALGEANIEMGHSMGTKYEVDDSLSPAAVHVFRTKTAPEKEKLEAALRKVPDFLAAWTYKGGFGATFKSGARVTLKEVNAASGLEVIDLILAPSKAGVRYYCPMHPERAALDPGVCPVCRMKLIPTPGARRYVCPMDGGERPDPGPCPKCGMKLDERHLAKEVSPKRRYVCSMDGGERSDPGPCPKCGMKLDERHLVSETPTRKKRVVYLRECCGGEFTEPGFC